MHPIRIVVAAAVLITVVVSTTDLSQHQPPAPWRMWSAVALALVFVAALMLGQGRPRLSLDPGRLVPRRWRTDTLVAMSLSATALMAISPRSSTSWLAFVVVVLAATSKEVMPAAIISLPSAIAFGYVTWYPDHSVAGLLINFIAVVAVFGFVTLRRGQREAQDLAAAQEQVIHAERARIDAAERQRQLAAQLHDVLAHTLSGLIVTLQTASLQARSEGVSTDLQDRLDSATGLAKDGLVGARQAVESLRRGVGDNTAAHPSNTVDLQQWWASTSSQMQRSAGLDLTTDGEACAVPPKRASLAQSVLRESLTNSLRYAAGHPVRVSFSDSAITVLSEGDVAESAPSTQQGGGFGLIGLRERVEATGGSFTAGPTPDGWLVAMSWPTTTAGSEP